MMHSYRLLFGIALQELLAEFECMLQLKQIQLPTKDYTKKNGGLMEVCLLKTQYFQHFIDFEGEDTVFSNL